MAKKKPVFVLVYSHRHGNDVSVHSTEARAWKVAALIAAEWIDGELPDDEDTRRKFAKLFKAKKHVEAVKVYVKALENRTSDYEDFEVLRRDVQ